MLRQSTTLLNGTSILHEREAPRYRATMPRLGRPPGGDSAQTRASIVAAARKVFAERGFTAATVSELAEAAALAPSAVYHYFGGKAELYEAVFDATADAIWTDIAAASRTHDTLLANIEQLLGSTLQLGAERPDHSNFLALVPTEARLHPEFTHLLDRRSKYQDATFSALARLGIATGELTGFGEWEATEIIRSTIMGWFFERHFRGGIQPKSGEPILALFRRLADANTAQR